MVISDFERVSLVDLTEDQKNWFAERMGENASGKVLVPSHLYAKFRKITGLEWVNKAVIKDWLIRNCYREI
jgi:hypothetical protein